MNYELMKLFLENDIKENESYIDEYGNIVVFYGRSVVPLIKKIDVIPCEIISRIKTVYKNGICNCM